jgi:hypothetical protein
MSNPAALKARSSLPALNLATLQRWWTYQRERFPIFAHGPVIAAFSFSTISYSTLVRGQAEFPNTSTIVVGFASALLFFMIMRVLDEFKDFEDDSRYRPYRAVPRGLVSLGELRVVGILAALTQFGLALWLSPSLIPFLLLVWGYLALMTKEFFVRDWLKRRPIAYMATHMPIIPLIDLYVTTTDWRVAGAALHGSLIWLLVVSFFNGVIMEIGRKIRAPQDEERGVQTYTFVWGRKRAVLAWLGAMLVTATSALIAASQIQFALPVAALLAVLLLAASVIAVRFLCLPVTRTAKWFEPMSALWTLVMYLSLGALPLLFKV